MTLYLLHSGQSSAKRLARRVPSLQPITNSQGVTKEDVVIRYGNTSEPDAGFWQINRKDALLGVRDRPAMIEALHLAGVRTPKTFRQTEVQWTRQYRVAVFNLQAIACFRTEERVVWLNRRIHQVHDSFIEVSPDADEQTRRICFLADRAVHALGLEMGLVSIGVTPHGRFGVIDVSATPVLSGRMLDIYSKAVSEYAQQIEDMMVPSVEDNRLLIGSDLEFMFKNRNSLMVLASRYFTPSGRIGCDARSINGDKAKRPLAELRPEPASSPERLCQNIDVLLRQAAAVAKQKHPTWVAGSAPFERFSLGGHIHFSGLPYSGRLVNLLDVYVGLPLMLIEDPTTAKRRRPKYGFLGDIRHKSYGGFEYRTPGSFLVDPGITLGAFALAFVVARHHQTLPYLALHTKENRLAFYRNDRDHLLSLAEAAYRNISQTTTYQQYKEAIDPIFTMIRNDEVWDESIDIRTAWGIEWQTKKRRNRTVAV